MLPQKHACHSVPIFYDQGNTGGHGALPPSLGRHRNAWPSEGEYTYAPPQRWLHSLEHGAAVFLYDPCLAEEDLCKIRAVISKWKARLGDGDPFRFVLTPYKHLMRPLAIVFWGRVYMSSCFAEEDIDEFIEANYRMAWEDIPPTVLRGAYTHLMVDFEAKLAQCPSSGFSSTLVTARALGPATPGIVGVLVVAALMVALAKRGRLFRPSHDPSIVLS